MNEAKPAKDIPCVARNWDRFRMRWLHRHAPEDALSRLLSTNDCGNEGAPLSHKMTRFQATSGCEEIACFLNDSFELGLGWPDRWHVIYRRPDFHRIIRWYLFQWAFGEWFGIRRWIWYKLLRRRCGRWNRRGVRA